MAFNRILHLGKTPLGGGGTTWNPADKSPPPSGSLVTLSNANLTMAASASAGGGVRSTTNFSAGKKYFEVTFDIAGSYGGLAGISNAAESFDPNNYNTGNKITAQATEGRGSGAVLPQGSILGVILNFDVSPRLAWFAANQASWGGVAWRYLDGSYEYFQSVDLNTNSTFSFSFTGPYFIYALGIGTAIGGTAFGCTLNTVGPFSNPYYATSLVPDGYSPWG